MASKQISTAPAGLMPHMGYSSVLGSHEQPLQTEGRSQGVLLEELRRRLIEMAGLNKLTQRITGVLSFEQVVQSVLEETMRCADPDLVLLFSRHRNRLTLEGVRRKKGIVGHEETPVHRVGECLCGAAVRLAKPVYSVNIHRDRRCTWDECKRAGVRSFAALPLICGTRILGILGLASCKTSRYFARQSGFLETLANSVAIAMRNAELYDTLRKKSTELETSERALRDLGGRLINAQEEERRRVARELHDDLNQRVSLLAIELELLARSLKPGAETAGRLRNLVDLSKKLSSDVHRLSRQLHPSVLEQLGLADAITALCRELGEAQGIDVAYTRGKLPRRIAPEVALCIYRIAQESLWNIAKHSGAQAATVQLCGSRAEIELTVTDTGAGFDPKEAERRRGLGLVSMQERLNLLGGRLTIDAAPGRGTRIHAHVPLKKAAPKER